jgi:hypothetical protein
MTANLAKPMDLAALHDWLQSVGFRTSEDHNRASYNVCPWYAYKRSSLPARPCECNSDKPGIQVVVNPHASELHSGMYESVTVGLRGEAGGTWWSIEAYAMAPHELPPKLEAIERSLVAAWNALKGVTNEPSSEIGA